MHSYEFCCFKQQITALFSTRRRCSLTALFQTFDVCAMQQIHFFFLCKFETFRKKKTNQKQKEKTMYKINIWTINVKITEISNDYEQKQSFKYQQAI